jgi:sulfate adenylyltransferase (ADP) / ATP adenylyltransferase
MNEFLKPGSLRSKVITTTKTALECKALQPITTDYEFIEQKNIPFLIRIVVNIDRKEKDKQKQEQKSKATKTEFNPFLPYEKDLFVSDLSKTHLCLLNKFNVVDYHLLIVTREFEEQENWLTLEDFEAMQLVLAEINGLAFYNGGKLAGASQRHKHLQLVPVPFVKGETKIPIAPAIESAIFDGEIGKIPVFNFEHSLVKLNSARSAKDLLEIYHQLLRSVGFIGDRPEGKKQTNSYNLLATREWMLIVPRCLESFQSIGINSLGFAGAMLVRDRQQLEIVKNCSPLKLLENVTQPKKNTDC